MTLHEFRAIPIQNDKPIQIIKKREQAFSFGNEGNREVQEPKTGMDETEKEEAHLTRALNATESGPGSQFTIPAPKFTLIDRTPRPQANFRLPLFYFPSNERKKEVMISIVEYTCSAEDFLWLDANKNIGPFASIEFTEDNFEYLMDRLEKLSPPPGKLISFQQFSSYIISEAQEDATIAHLADKTVLNPVYQHWSNARRKMGNALLRRLATPTPLTNKDLTYSFRLLSREISRKQLKVNQFWHMERVEHILESIRQIKQILDDVRKREELKLGYIKTVNKIQLYQLFILQRRKEVEISSSEFPQWMFSGQSQQKLYNQSLSTSTPLLTSLSRSGSTITLGKQTDEDSLEEDPKQIDLYIKTRLKTPVPTEESSSEDSLFGTTSEDSHSRRARQKTRKQQRSTRGSSRRRQRQHSLDTQQDTGAASLSGDSEESFSDVNFDVSATAQQAPPIQSLTAHLENFDIIGETMQYLTQVRGTAADMITNWRDLSPFTVDDRHAKENKLYDSESEMIWSSADGESNADDEQSGDGRWELGSSEGKEGEASGELFAMIGQMLSEWGQKGELGPNTAMLKDTEEAQPDRADEAVNHEIVSFLLRCYSEQGRSETDGPTGDQQQTRGEALTRTVKARIQRKRGISATSASASQLTYQPSSTPEHPRLDTTPSNPSTSPHVSEQSPQLVSSPFHLASPFSPDTSPQHTSSPKTPPPTALPLIPPQTHSPSVHSPSSTHSHNSDSDVSDDFLNSDEECAALSMGLLTPFDVFLLRRRRNFFRRTERLMKSTGRMGNAEESHTEMLIDRPDLEQNTISDKQTTLWLLEREKRKNELLEELRGASVEQKTKTDSAAIDHLLELLNSTTIDPLLSTLTDDEQLSLLTNISLSTIQQFPESQFH